MSGGPPEGYIAALHGVIDQLTAPLEAAQAPHRVCARGCNACCVDGLTVFEVEADRIRGEFGALLTTAQPGPLGACAMLGAEGECRVYAARPYVCRTQGLPLRWAEAGPDGRPAERRDVCPKNDPGPGALEALPAERCWAIGPVEGRLQAAQQLRGGQTRIAIRSLFSTTGSPSRTVQSAR